MIVVTAILLALGAILYTLAVREKDLPAPAPVSPVARLEERKVTIYENLRDLLFEYRVGKLSETDYQQTKQGLQQELASVMEAIDRVSGTTGPGVKPAPAPAPAPETPPAVAGTVCPRCGAKFEQALKFCGECGNSMAGGTA